LARHPPADTAALQERLDATPKAPRKLAAAIWKALATPLADEVELPPIRTDEPDKQTLRKLQDAIAARTAELGLPDGVLASRRWLEPLLESLRNNVPWPGPLEGWRRAQLEPALAALDLRPPPSRPAAGEVPGPPV
jgi:ribonuclease D